SPPSLTTRVISEERVALIRDVTQSSDRRRQRDAPAGNRPKELRISIPARWRPASMDPRAEPHIINARNSTECGRELMRLLLRLQSGSEPAGAPLRPPFVKSSGGPPQAPCKLRSHACARLSYMSSRRRSRQPPVTGPAKRTLPVKTDENAARKSTLS